MTCRSSKVKCDEQRPCCRRCIRLRRTCTYKLSSRASTPHSESAFSETTYQSSIDHLGRVEEDLEENDQAQLAILTQNRVSEFSATFHWLESPPDGSVDSSTHDSIWTPQHDPNILESPSALSLMTSQDIYLCTTIDRLAIDETQHQSSFSSFLQAVDPPIISTIDPVNWRHFKTYVVELGVHHRTVATSIFAFQTTFEALNNGIPASKVSKDAYRAAKLSLDVMLFDSSESVEVILSIALLLCLREMHALDDIGLCLGRVGADSILVRRLNAWCTSEDHSSVATRIITWLKLLHASGRRGGNPGMLSKFVLDQLPDECNTTIFTHNDQANAADIFYTCLSASVFELYRKMQNLSIEVANLSHYHRSRITIDDQMEVAEIMSNIKKKMNSLWEERPHLMRLNPADIRAQVASRIAERLINLIGLCKATYHTELIEMGRTLSDPPLASNEARAAIREIRAIIESDWEARTSDGRLNPGYLRPLFLCAIESLRIQDTEWAVDHLRQIKDPICRSDFFTSFAENLVVAQTAKRRRVTTKFFCQQKFGISPPFL